MIQRNKKRKLIIPTPAKLSGAEGIRDGKTLDTENTSVFPKCSVSSDELVRIAWKVLTNYSNINERKFKKQMMEETIIKVIEKTLLKLTGRCSMFPPKSENTL